MVLFFEPGVTFRTLWKAQAVVLCARLTAREAFRKALTTVRTEMITIKIPDRLKNVIVSAIFAQLVPLGIPKCNCNPRVFPRNCYISRELIRLGIKKCSCICNLPKINSRKQKKLHVIILMTRAWPKIICPPLQPLQVGPRLP